MKRAFRDPLKPRGNVEIFTSIGVPDVIRGKKIVPPTEAARALIAAGRAVQLYESAKIDFSKTKLLRVDSNRNIIVNGGRDKVLTSLTTGFVLVIARMSIGDRGTIPSDSTVPKVPTATQTALFNETFRSDIDTTVLSVGVTNDSVEFIKTFSATDVPITSFSNQANPVVNEVGLIMCDLLNGDPLPRADVAAPAAPPTDESLFATRTFKSVPFVAANQITVTIRYTIFIE